MEESIRAYARLRLEGAREELITAEELLQNGRFRAAVSRAYYAVFYMASAALFARAQARAKHSGVESAFAQFLVKPGDIEPEYSRIYQQARRQREDVDYAETPHIDESSVRQTVVDAARFVSRIEQFLRDVGAL